MKNLNFITIGSGQVFKKYWLRSSQENLINITDVIDIIPKSEFFSQYPHFQGKYHQTASVIQTCNIVSKIKDNEDLNIANLVPSNLRYKVAKGILDDKRSNSSHLFLEKPYTQKETEINHFLKLIQDYNNRLHFSGKYSACRANILYPYLPTNELPQKITGRLIEGNDYYQNISSSYYKDGPELDLGFHLLDIITNIIYRVEKPSTVKILAKYDLVKIDPHFLPKMGFGCKFDLITISNKKITVDIQAGKVDSATQRYIELDYSNTKYLQEYTSHDSTDRVFQIFNDHKTILEKRDHKSNYYAQELSEKYFCKQTVDVQKQHLFSNYLALKIKQASL